MESSQIENKNDNGSDNDHQPVKFMTPSNSRRNTPNYKHGSLNNHNDHTNRDTLVNEHRKNDPYLSKSFVSPSKHFPTPSSVLATSLPVRHHGSVSIFSTDNNNEQALKKNEQLSELPVKIIQSTTANGKKKSSHDVNKSPIIDKKNLIDVTATLKASCQTSEPQSIPRRESKTHKRKIMEEEAIRELGQLMNSSLRRLHRDLVIFRTGSCKG